jgi:hypothetical protein
MNQGPVFSAYVNASGACARSEQISKHAIHCREFHFLGSYHRSIFMRLNNKFFRLTKFVKLQGGPIWLGKEYDSTKSQCFCETSGLLHR